MLKKELTKILPITPLTIRQYIREGKIKGSKIGKNWYVKKQDLEAFLEGDRVIIKLTKGKKRFRRANF